MAHSRRQRSKAQHLALTIPWWLWLVFAVCTFAIFHWMANLPRTGSGPDAVARSLNIGVGYLGRIIVPTVCLLVALLAFVAQRRGSSQASVTAVAESEHPPREVDPSRAPERDLYPMWRDVAPSDPAKSPDTSRWSLELLRALEWKRLEQLCAAYFRALRFRVDESAAGPDGGIDLRLFVGSKERPDILVQCKAWNAWKVGVKEIRELFGVMASEAVREGIFVTTSTFTSEAVEFARGKDIALIDGEDLFRKLLDLPEQDQTRILRLATAGDFTTPTCASCGSKMVERTTKGSGKRFWGCREFPACRTTLPMNNSNGPT